MRAAIQDNPANVTYNKAGQFVVLGQNGLTTVLMSNGDRVDMQPNGRLSVSGGAFEISTRADGTTVVHHPQSDTGVTFPRNAPRSGTAYDSKNTYPIREDHRRTAPRNVGNA